MVPSRINLVVQIKKSSSRRSGAKENKTWHGGSDEKKVTIISAPFQNKILHENLN